MFVRKFQIALLLVLSLLLATAAFAQTSETGAITGKVMQAGVGLPGVTVEVRSPALQGRRTEVTDAVGNFRFSLLPPGDYSMNASLSGFNTVKQQNIRVGLNRTVTLDVAMSAAVTETITVTGAAPIVDVSSNASGTNVTAETIRSLPIPRNFTSVAQLAPGTQSDARGTTVYGSSGAENQYVIDGLNTTNVSHGVEGKRLNFDFIQEVEVITGGLPAEYGRTTGGIVNAVTKSGSNEFHGDVFGYTAGGGLLANPKYQGDLPATSTTIGDIDEQYDFGANLGGYILKDRLWFFGAYDRVKQTDLSIRINTPLVVPGFSVPVGGSIPTSIERDLYAGKLTLALTSSQAFNFSLFGDPSTTEGAVAAIAGAPSTFLGTIDTGGTDWNGRYTGVFGANWNVNASYGKHIEKNTLGGEGTTILRITDQTVIPNTITGGLGFFRNTEYNRDVAKADISAFFGSHQFKVGGDQEKLVDNENIFTSGGDRIRKRCSVSVVNNICNGLIFYTHEARINDLSPTLDKTNPATFASNIVNPQIISPKTENTAFYVQDAWKVMSNLTLNLGVRWENIKVGSREGAWRIDLKDNVAPRLGVIWDPENNGRSKLYANYGRFFEAIPTDINVRAFGGELSIQVNNLSPTPGDLTPNNAAPTITRGGARFTFLGGGTEPVDPNLKGQHIDEYLGGYDREVMPNLSVGIKGTYRKLGDVIEDMLIGTTGEYLIANPGTGIGTSASTINGDLVNTPPAKRTYKGVELHATKRFSNNYQFFTSYLWSRLEGNYDGTFQVSTGQLDPNINSAFDYADFIVNNSGLLSNDRTHQFKFYGSYTVPTGFARGLDTGVAFQYASGTPLTAQGYEFAGYRNYEYYLTPRGALGRGPADWEADFHLGYPITFGQARVSLLVDVFNLLNRQAISRLDNRYDLSSDAPCSTNPNKGVPTAICNGFGGLLNKPGTVEPVAQLADPRAMATNPDFLKAGLAFTGQRSFRVGARFSF